MARGPGLGVVGTPGFSILADRVVPHERGPVFCVMCSLFRSRERIFDENFVLHSKFFCVT